MTPRTDPAWPSAEATADAFRLAGKIHALSPVDGAWSNRLFRLQVGYRTFAVKEMRNPWDDENWLAWLTAAWDFEQRAIAAGADAPEPIPNPADGHCLGWVARDEGESLAPVRVHRWVEGTPANTGPVEPEVARWAGRLLATLHGLGIVPAERDLFPRPNTDTADHWPELVEAAGRAGSPWAERLASVGPEVRSIAELATAASNRPGEEVMTHGDIDQKNLVLSHSGPVLCDWDVAAPLVPQAELADVAFSLGSWERMDISRAVVAAYRAAGGTDVRIEAADLGRTLTISLDWIAFNVERAIGVREEGRQEVDLAARLVPTLLDELPKHVDAAWRAGDLLNE